MKPFISICIPAYKRQDFLSRLLDSIAGQTYRDFEVIITDDSGDATVASLAAQYESLFPLRYISNPQALGTPANWNAGIRHATGQWIKLMHDDDWFTDSSSLQQFADAATQAGSGFIFSGFYEVDLDNGHRELHVLQGWRKRLLQRSPYNILSRNVIGHPSTTLLRNDQDSWYNERLKWVVDIEFYVRQLNKNGGRFVDIPHPLVCLGMSNEQVTKTVFRKPAVEIPENICLLNIITPAGLRPIMAYDYFWRFLRNLSIRDMAYLEQYNQECPIPALIGRMVAQQRSIPLPLLKHGIISKAAMLLSYAICRITGLLR
ncbi:glycosyltransferase family 2 protein [Paraflavitalea pollutisoli]|uniref:glycosyltransferase family 2 protein n=1 Tax=Paraflavitalea pollutisoli TaxID=3034143 RepID=UPI0023EADE5F|nr:glycosyltransferase family 2 protein [Paraflavitalea sp. H1-2-19X]